MRSRASAIARPRLGAPARLAVALERRPVSNPARCRLNSDAKHLYGSKFLPFALRIPNSALKEFSTRRSDQVRASQTFEIMNPAPNGKIARSADAKPSFGHRQAGGVSAADLVLRNQAMNPLCSATSNDWQCDTKPHTHRVFPVTRHPSPDPRHSLVAPKPRVGGSPFNPSMKIAKRTQSQNGVYTFKSSVSVVSVSPASTKRTQFCPDIPRGGDSLSPPVLGADLPRQVARHTRQCVYRKSFVVIPKTLNEFAKIQPNPA
jgi:hypothetical protein